MFEDLQNSASFTPDNEAELNALLNEHKPRKGFKLTVGPGKFLGMNAFQRFVISALLFFVVLILGIMLMMIVSTAGL